MREKEGPAGRVTPVCGAQCEHQRTHQSQEKLFSRKNAPGGFQQEPHYGCSPAEKAMSEFALGPLTL